MNEIGIGLLGFGTVGAGVVKGLQRNGDVMASRLGFRPVLRGIADLDLTTDRGVVVDRNLLTPDAAAVIDNPAVDVVVELIGGTGAARQLVTRALERGKPVVTANKKLLAEHGKELFQLAAAKGTEIRFGASVGGGIPIIRSLREGLVANRIQRIRGILNGTCNYILTRMESEGLAFDAVLAEAQRLGYAEANPALDIDGHDTAHKAVILAGLAFGGMVPLAAVSVEGIRGLSDQDIRYARDLGYCIKLLAVIHGGDDAVEVRVHPAMVSVRHMLASVHGVFNAVLVSGDMTGDTLYYGRGAGQEPTAATVLADIADAGAARLGRGPRGGQAFAGEVRLKPSGEVLSRHYLRLTVMDRPGVLGSITSVLGRHGISIASFLQKEVNAGAYVPVVIVTHEAREKLVSAALEEIGRMDIVEGRPVRIRIED